MAARERSPRVGSLNLKRRAERATLPARGTELLCAAFIAEAGGAVTVGTAQERRVCAEGLGRSRDVMSLATRAPLTRRAPAARRPYVNVCDERACSTNTAKRGGGLRGRCR